MKGIYRWLNPEGLDAVSIVIPEDCVFCEAVEITEEGPKRKRMYPAKDGSAVEFPVVQVWDDPARSPVLKRSKKGWREEDPSELVKKWEEVRLEMFRTHMLSAYHSMQVVFLQPPVAEAVAFHHGDTLYEGWRIEMVAAFFGGFKPSGLEEYKDKVKIITDVRPHLRLV